MENGPPYRMPGRITDHHCQCAAKGNTSLDGFLNKLMVVLLHMIFLHSMRSNFSAVSDKEQGDCSNTGMGANDLPDIPDQDILDAKPLLEGL